VPATHVDAEDEGAFRETFLAVTQNPEYHSALRAFSKVLYVFAIESSQTWPRSLLDSITYHLQAGLVDLRHLQGFFASWSDQAPEPWDDGQEVDEKTKKQQRLCQLAARITRELGKLANDLEKEIGDWKLGE
jgi:hypothetical protein